MTGTGKHESLLEKYARPILAGPAARIHAIAAAAELDFGKTEIVDTPDSQASAAKAVELVRSGRAELLMKGSLWMFPLTTKCSS